LQLAHWLTLLLCRFVVCDHRHEKIQADKWEQFRAKDPTKVGFKFPSQNDATKRTGPNYTGSAPSGNAPIFGGVSNASSPASGGAASNPASFTLF
jgi:hypothetical protein